MWIRLNSRVTGLRCIESILPRLQATLTMQRLRRYQVYYQRLEQRADSHRLAAGKRKVLRGLNRYLEYAGRDLK